MITVSRVADVTEMREVWKIRTKVFIKEQHVPSDLEMDEFDEVAIHFLACIDGEIAGTGRIFKDTKLPDVARLGRVAVFPHLRRRGVARAIVRELLEWAREEAIGCVILHSQLSSIDLYKEFGFQEIGDPFLEAGISHTEMSIHLQDADFTGGVC